MPARTPLDADIILAATEEILRRHGPDKATVVDVARALGVSHAAVYKHFASKQALREAVTRRWLDRTRDTLAVIAADRAVPPAQRLRAWLHAVLAGKQAKIREAPELFAAYGILAAAHSTVATDHVADLLGQLTAIIADGAADGGFRTGDAEATARAVFHATVRFHHLAHAGEWQNPGIDTDLDDVCSLLLEGLQAPASP
ncbi:TetR family transcriptional regulator [Nonomuraea roseoviolacea subsp. roseoviolacea]|uniref:AcrR family transcriptional regulator n=1 Tax=Nonomuraea roseoviolacea subsp. carminata TaxID=160689 RepID=A0ABT1KCR0_9ACTN|nr:TetR family transcriptional regulator [Nonomuraea roseoviolacea]MCP2351793.1 AcrR family transcriptional regulator [Nonomuraea roseoviolacea subsp. carminata]